MTEWVKEWFVKHGSIKIVQGRLVVTDTNL